MEDNKRTPRGPHHGPGAPIEKAKDFKGSIIRLFKELKGYKILIIVSLILACVGSILSISAPDKLSKLTDKISEGLVINTNNFEKLTTTITTNLSNNNIHDIEIDNVKITANDQLKFIDILNKIEKNASSSEIYKKLDKMPDSVQKVIEPTMDIEGIKLSLIHI